MLDSPTAPRAQPTGHRIAGELVDRAPGEHLTSYDPSTGNPLGTVPQGTADDVAAAVASARYAAPDWVDLSVSERAELLHRTADRIREAADMLTRLHTAEIGRPIDESRGAVAAAADAFDEFAALGPLHRGRSLRGGPDAVDLMEPTARGVAAVITPWNDPLPIAATHLAANLVVGNPVILKPSELAPLCSTALFDLIDVPTGVAALVHGDGRTGAALAASDVDVVAHTGSVQAGREIATRCGQRLARAIVELGGCDPFIVDADVDPVHAANQIVLGAFTHAGQLCTAAERILVHRAVAEPVIDALIAHSRALRVGPADDPRTEMGPLISTEARDRVRVMIADAVDRGARILTGGTIPDHLDEAGSFLSPTVITDVPVDAPLWAEEIFGPVAPIRIVDSFEEALALAADTHYGLAATVLTSSFDHAAAARRRLGVGTLKINAVFGGAPAGSAEPAGCSGLGRGYGPELLDEVTRLSVFHQSPHP